LYLVATNQIDHIVVKFMHLVLTSSGLDVMAKSHLLADVVTS
jgi:hypothetical protein